MDNNVNTDVKAAMSTAHQAAADFAQSRMGYDRIRLNGYLAFVIGICITIWTCLAVTNAQNAHIRSNFARDTDKVSADTSARLRTYFDVLLSLKGLFAATGDVDREQFANFVQTLRLSERYPGFRAIQFVRAVPGVELAR